MTVPRPEGHREEVIPMIWEEKLSEKGARKDVWYSVKRMQPTHGHLL